MLLVHAHAWLPSPGHKLWPEIEKGPIICEPPSAHLVLETQLWEGPLDGLDGLLHRRVQGRTPQVNLLGLAVAAAQKLKGEIIKKNKLVHL